MKSTEKSIAKMEINAIGAISRNQEINYFCTGHATMNRTLLKELSKDQLVDRILQLESKLPSTENLCKKPFRPMQWSKYAFRMVAFHVAYLGWPFHGVAYQPPAVADSEPSVQTVESVFFDACKRIRLFPFDSLDECKFSRSGRTDAGVSAFSQIFGMKIRSGLSESTLSTNPMQTEGEMDYLKMLNGCLPSTVRVLGWTPIPNLSSDTSNSAAFQNIEHSQIDETASGVTLPRLRTNLEWDARFSCSYRHYRYFFFANNSLNIEAMNKAAAFLVGEHDFRLFCRNDSKNESNSSNKPNQVETDNSGQSSSNNIMHKSSTADMHPKNYTRRIWKASIAPVETSSSILKTFQLEVKGSGFLYNQIRCIMGVLYHVGLGLEEPEIVQKMLHPDTVARIHSKPPYEIACENGLILWDCGYENEHALVNWVRSPAYDRSVFRPLMEELKVHETKACIIKAVLDELSGNSKYPEMSEVYASPKYLSYQVPSQSISKFIERYKNSAGEDSVAAKRRKLN